MFIIEWMKDGAWVPEKGDYFMRADGTGGAIATARARYTKDGVPRRVCSWPEVVEIWTFETPRKRKQATIRSAA